MLDIFTDVKPIDDIHIHPGYRSLPDLSSVLKIGIDIETDGLELYNRIYMIGLITGSGLIKIITDLDESIMLRKFAIFIGDLVQKSKIILYGHNLFKFDLPRIIARCNHHDISCPFEYFERWNGNRVDKYYDQHAKIDFYHYHDIGLNNADIVDTMALTILNDSKYLFSDKSLKTVAIESGCRSDRRLELDHNEIRSLWMSENFDKLNEYLTYDLIDTKSIFDKFIPPYYYMGNYLPMNLQEIVSSGNATKVNIILKNHYHPKFGEITPDEKRIYEGAFTNCKPGFYKGVVKYDVSSMYPAIMLNYRCWPKRKDPQMIFLSVLKTLSNLRLQYKRDAGEQSKSMSDAMKILINSFYGALGSTIDFNDMDAAERVCAYGRLIVKRMMDLITSTKAIVVETDTDGIIVADADPVKIELALRNGLPSFINVEKEYTATWAFISGAKNYILKIGDKLIFRGLFRKRNRMPLQIKFFTDFCDLHFFDESAAGAYYTLLRSDILTRRMDVNLLKTHRKIAKSEKYWVELGKHPGDYIDDYYGTNNRGKKIKVETGNYNTDYYLKKIDEWYLSIVSPDPPESMEEDSDTD